MPPRSTIPVQSRPRFGRVAIALLPLALAPACSPATPTPPATPPATHTTPAPLPPIAFLEDDFDKAQSLALAQHKLLFVDAWAPWCHTCLSMRNFVFPNPSLRPLASQVVFAAVDTDKASSEAFLSRFPVSAWPSLFIIDPASGKLLAFWPGSASAAELRALVDDAVRIADASAPPGDPLRSLADARAAQASGQLAAARSAFEQLLATTPPQWPRRSDALIGLLDTLRQAKDFTGCTTVGQQYLGHVAGASKPADFAWLLLDCASQTAPGPLRTAAEHAAMNKLQQLVQTPPADASVDDRADMLGTLADALEATGDKQGAARAHDQRIALLEQSSRSAPTPAIAATFDYLLASSYIARGRGDDAIRLLQAREREMPESYEPPARLADVFVALGRYQDALPAVDRALTHAYGPRKMRYLGTKAAILGKLGRAQEQVEVLRQEVAGWDALGKAQVNQARRADAVRRLQEATGAAPSAPLPAN